MQHNEEAYKSTLISKNVVVHGKRTSIRLEPEMWSAVKEIAKRERCTIHRICTIVNDRKKEGTSLTAAIRVFIMSYFRVAATEDGHILAGHGTQHIRSVYPMDRNNKGKGAEVDQGGARRFVPNPSVPLRQAGSSLHG